MSLFREPQDESIFHLGIDDYARAYMLETVRWTKFLAVIGFIFSALLIMAGVTAAFVINSGHYASPVSAGLIVGYLAGALLYIYPALALYQFSQNLRAALLRGDMQRFNLAMKHQRNMFRYLGILTIALIGIYGAVVLFIALGSSFHI